jgi:hypothetical protein
MVHAGQALTGQTLNGFWAEFEAMSAQKRLILSLDKAGVGGQIEARVSWLRTATDNDIATFIESTLGYARPAKVGGFGGGDSQIARAAIEAAKRILAVGAM